MISGGCQCGDVRFRIEGRLGRASICHCRMCQKAFGGPFGALVSARIADVVWTRGERSRFASSDTVRRGFCAACGTPLTFEHPGEMIDISIAALDDPSLAPPAVQLASGSRLPWIDHVADLPHEKPPPGYYEAVVSHQHPDHDTDDWPR